MRSRQVSITSALYSELTYNVSTMKFEDLFSAQSSQYAQYRPTYPDVVYEYLASIVPARSLVWDCGTGNGQAAAGLAQYFERVYATDASAGQIAHARPHPRVEYHLENAEQVALEFASADLVTVAQAVHWFDLDKFYAEVRRVLKADGVIAVWSYTLPEVSSQIDEVTARYYSETLSGSWSKGIRYVEEKYRTLPFPFEEVSSPSFFIEDKWDFEQFAGFLNSWSGVQEYLRTKGVHPLKEIWDELTDGWGDEKEKRLIRWRLYFRIGKNG